MEKLKRNKETFIVDGNEISGYVIDDRNYGTKLDPIRFISITTNGKLDGVIVLYQLEPEMFTLNYPKNEFCDFEKRASSLKTLFFNYKNKLYIKSIFCRYNTSKYFGAYAFDINYYNEEIFKNKSDLSYKKINRIEIFFVKWLESHNYL